MTSCAAAFEEFVCLTPRIFLRSNVEAGGSMAKDQVLAIYLANCTLLVAVVTTKSEMWQWLVDMDYSKVVSNWQPNWDEENAERESICPRSPMAV